MATERFEMRIDSELLERLDQWRNAEDDNPSRAEAVRRLMEMALESDSKYQPTHLSDGEKLIAMMLGDVIKGLNIKSDTDIDLVEKVIVGGHYWALDWEMQGIFHNHRDKRSRVSFVVDVLDMWEFLEDAHEKLSDDDKERLAVEAEPFGKYVKFSGFDGNNETEHMGIAMFLIRDLNRFTRFKDHNMNSHMPTLERYSKMLRAFEPIRETLVFGKAMSVEQLGAVLNARKAV